MKHTFYLKKPNSEKETLIMFRCYFNDEKKTFFYSTGEKIHPKHWCKENKFPKAKGALKAPNYASIKTQLDRYSNSFEVLVNQLKTTDEKITSLKLKRTFNKEFKKSATGKSSFFQTFDEFTGEKTKQKKWSNSTLVQYQILSKHLGAFEKYNRRKLTFEAVNDKFYTKFLDYCYTQLNHSQNSVSRNCVLLKAFLRWAYDKNYTYHAGYKHIHNIKTTVTESVALTLEQVQFIYSKQYSHKRMEIAKDMFVFQCLTGLRFGELKLVNRRNCIDGFLHLKEEKDKNKKARIIPLTLIPLSILKKYDYNLKSVTNVTQNITVKDLFKEAGFKDETESTRLKGKESEIIIKPFYDRIGTHTARRTFVTILKNKGMNDKQIMEMTGHKNPKTFNLYYKTDQDTTHKEVSNIFNTIKPSNLKAV